MVTPNTLCISVSWDNTSAICKIVFPVFSAEKLWNLVCGVWETVLMDIFNAYPFILHSYCIIEAIASGKILLLSWQFRRCCCPSEKRLNYVFFFRLHLDLCVLWCRRGYGSFSPVADNPLNVPNTIEIAVPKKNQFLSS